MGGEGHNQMSDKPILCVDFDGVLHAYTSGWMGAAVIPDPPVPGAIAWLLEAVDRFEVVIYSSRSKDPEGREAMATWLRHHLGSSTALLTFAHEKPAAFLTIDDRAIKFDGDWSKLAPAKLLEFKPWYQHEEQARTVSPRVIAEELTDSVVHGDSHA